MAVMRVTIIQNSDKNALVHRAGCADIARRELRDRAYLSHWDAEVASRQAAANNAWSDFLSEDMTETSALGYTSFYPCCDELPDTAPAVYQEQEKKDHVNRPGPRPGPGHR